MMHIRQVCDGCNRSRTLDIDLKGGRQDIEQAGQQGGWRQVDDLGHILCSNCIKRALKK